MLANQINAFKGLQFEEDLSDDADNDDSYEASVHEEIDEKLKLRSEQINLKKLLDTDNGENIKIFKRKADIHSLNLKYFRDSDMGKRDIKTDLQLKIKKDE